MNTTDATYAHRAPACRPHNGTAPVDCGGSAANASESRLSLCLHGIVAFCWAASRGALQRMLFTYLQSTVVRIWRSVVIPRGGQGCAEPAMKEGAAEGPAAWGLSAPTTSAKKVSWSYLRGVSLALSELCQDCSYGGGRIPLSAILDLMRQHQSAFVPLGPHVEKDVPKRLIQLANENAVFFDPFEKYVIVPQETRQKYAERRQELLAEGVNPADLSVFGAALTQHLTSSKRVTNTAVASYKEQFLLAQWKQKRSKSCALTREESLMSIADAICPPSLKPETSAPEGNARGNGISRRGHSIVLDMAKIIGHCGRVEDTRQENQLRRGHSMLPEISAIIYQRDALEVENSRLRTIVEQVD
ncbi:hypothetical protein BJV78DRAFT_1241601 [Lactifluus subvellereus]|nr:hypothetical protein BJV78DRAFT_1241601 [Lactifluus subvellereus]